MIATAPTIFAMFSNREVLDPAISASSAKSQFW